MKKLMIMLAAVALTASCDEIADQMAKVPTFFIPEIMYNGQTFQVTRFATCKYQFSTDSKYLTITETSDGKFIAKADGTWVSETSLKTIPVKVTAVNPDDASVEPQVEETVLIDWGLKLYEGDAVVSNTELIAGNIYRLEMISANTGLKIETILGGATDKTNPQALEWTFAADKVQEVSRTATTLEFKPIATGIFGIAASLGEYKVNMSGNVH
ncbi:MAG: hypothetical protein ACI3Y9_10085 [Candidatus Cryptobacteroides sp.]